MLKRGILILICTGFMPAFQNCSSGESGGGSSPADQFPFSRSAVYFQQSQTLETEVHYEPGAEPYVGNTLNGRAYWAILQENLSAIFQYRSTPPTLKIPKTLAEMHAMPTQNKTTWTSTDLLALHAQYKLSEPTTANSRFYIFFLRGNFADESGPRTGVIGVHVGGTPVLAIFKQVIQNANVNPNGPAAKFMEQATLIHEMGHALGFVNHGVPMTTAHEDTAHPAHTVNSNCVMYWQNEGASDLQAFIQNYLVSSSVVMWGPEVLQDARNISR